MTESDVGETVSGPTVLTVLLNWRTPEMTLKAAAAAERAMEGIAGGIVVVDNDSGDGSYEQMSEALKDRPHVRVRYTEAQDRLRAGLAGPTGVLDSPGFTWGYRGALVPLATASTLAGASDAWARVGARYGEEARLWQQALLVGPAAPGASSVNPRVRYEEVRRLAHRADAAAASNRRLLFGLQDRPVIGPAIEVSGAAPRLEGA